jgi:hypothetical protein
LFPITLHVAFAVLASWRLTELIALDRIAEPLRKKLPLYVLRCPRCLSVWAGAVSTALFVFFPWANWPLAFAWLYLAHNEFVSTRKSLREGNRFIMQVEPNGAASIIRSDFDNNTLRNILAQYVGALSGQNPNQPQHQQN